MFLGQVCELCHILWSDNECRESCGEHPCQCGSVRCCGNSSIWHRTLHDQQVGVAVLQQYNNTMYRSVVLQCITYTWNYKRVREKKGERLRSRRAESDNLCSLKVKEILGSHLVRTGFCFVRFGRRNSTAYTMICGGVACLVILGLPKCEKFLVLPKLSDIWLAMARSVYSLLCSRYKQVGCILYGVVLLISFLSPFLPDSYLHSTTSAMLGKMCISISFSVIWCYTAELYPTSVR